MFLTPGLVVELFANDDMTNRIGAPITGPKTNSHALHYQCLDLAKELKDKLAQVKSVRITTPSLSHESLNGYWVQIARNTESITRYATARIESSEATSDFEST